MEFNFVLYFNFSSVMLLGKFCDLLSENKCGIRYFLSYVYLIIAIKYLAGNLVAVILPKKVHFKKKIFQKKYVLFSWGVQKYDSNAQHIDSCKNNTVCTERSNCRKESLKEDWSIQNQNYKDTTIIIKNINSIKGLTDE